MSSMSGQQNFRTEKNTSFYFLFNNHFTSHLTKKSEQRNVYNYTPNTDGVKILIITEISNLFIKTKKKTK